jgi:hypothetical protein
LKAKIKQSKKKVEKNEPWNILLFGFFPFWSS